MKKLMLFASALAGLFLAASCQQENLEPVRSNTVTITVEAPGAINTKAIADGTNVNEVHYAVYKTNSGEDYSIDDSGAIDGPLAQGVVEMINKRASIDFDLLRDQNYTVIFWAQVAGADHYTLGDLRTITIDDDVVDGNDETRAAFFARYDFSTYEHKDHTVTLRRPFAQLNLLTTLESLTPVQQGQTTGYTLDVQTSQVKVVGLGKSFNTLTGVAPAADETLLYEMAATPAKQGQATLNVGGKDYHYVSMNYLFVPEEEKLVDIKYNVVTDKGSIENEIVAVPVKENYRTNVIGNLFTKETKFEIIVDAEFETPEHVIGDDWTQTGEYKYVVNEGASAATLADILAHADAQAKAAATKAAGPEVIITLNGDVEWETGAEIGSTPLLPEDSPISAVVINGNGKTFTATGKGVGKVRLANGGKLTFNKVKIVDHSVSYAENAWEYGYLEFGGVIRLEDCEVVNAIMVSGETAAFKNCSFNSNNDNEYDVWVDNGSAYFTDCTFAGARGLKVHEAYGSEVVEVAVNGCTFGPLSKKPGIALGDLNAKTTVSVKNSTFDRCQAGDQGLFIYETDTDVKTFTFVCQNNFVVPVGDEPYVQEDGTITVATSQALKTALSTATADDEIVLAPGTYKMETYKAGVKIEGTDKASVIVDVKGAQFGVHGDVNIEKVTLQFADANYTGFQHTATEVYTNCNIEGQPFLYGENVTFNSCTFVQTSSDLYNVWTYGAKNVTFNACTFNSAGKSVLVYAEKGADQNVTLNKCVLNASVSVAGKAAVEIDSSFPSGGTGKYTVTLNNTVAKGFAEGSVSKSTLWNVKKGEANCDVLVNGKKMLAAGVATEDGAYLLLDAKGLYWFANQVNVAKNAFSGKTVKLAANIDLANEAWTPVGQTGATTFNGVFDGQGYTIYNLNVNSEAQTGANYSSGLFGWVESHEKDHGHLKNVTISSAVVKGHHNCGALVGYITQETALVDNCHVTGATITCTKANAEAEGDKAGALIGNATVATPVNNCTAANSTVSAGRDAGQVIGAGRDANVTECSATGVAVSANGTSTGQNVRNEVIGRLF